MSPKARLALILLAPIGLALASLWFAAVFNALRYLVLHGQEVGTDMWIRTVLALISAGAFAFLAYKFVKIIRERPKIKKRSKR